MTTVHQWVLPDESASMALGKQLAGLPLGGVLLTLSGPLGAGKTTLVRAILRSLGCRGEIPSPTYALVQLYAHLTPQVVHMDLYRMQCPSELHDLGFEEWLTPQHLMLVEWPEKGEGVLPPGDLHLALSWQDNGRLCACEVGSVRGEGLLAVLKNEGTL